MKNKFIQTCMVVAIAGLISMNTYSQEKKSERTGTTQIRNDSYSVTIDDSDVPSKINITYGDGEKFYKMKVVDSKIVELTVDDKKVPPEEFSRYESLLKKILNKIAEDRKTAEEDRKRATIERDRAERDGERAGRERDRADRDREQADANREESETQRERTLEVARASEIDRRHADEDREHAKLNRVRADRERDQSQMHRQRAEEDRKLIHDLLDELVKEKLVEDKDEVYSLIIDDKEFTINGKKQTEQLHNKFREKYLKKPGSRINFRNDGNFRRLSID